MSEQNKWLDRIDKLLSTVENVNNGLSVLRSILEDTTEEPKLPQLPTPDEVDDILNHTKIESADDYFALVAYNGIADSMYDYANYLSSEGSRFLTGELSDSLRNEMIHHSIPYVFAIMCGLKGVFSAVYEFKKTQYKQYQKIFAFLHHFLDEESCLEELYAFEFFADVSELWEIVVMIMDEIDEQNNIEIFSSYLQAYCYDITRVSGNTFEILNSDESNWTKRKVLKKYQKNIHLYAKAIMSRLDTELYLLQKEMS